MGRFSRRALVLPALAALALMRCGDTDSKDASKKNDAGVQDQSSDHVEPEDVTSADEADVVVPGITAGTCGALAWADHYGGDDEGKLSSDEAVRGVVTDSSGNVYATGSYRGDADFGGGPVVAGKQNRSLFVLKLDPSGKHVYSKGFGDPSSGILYAPQARAHAIALGAQQSPIVVGSFAGTIDPGTGTTLASNEPLFAEAGGGCFQCSSDILVMAFDPDGKTTWAKSFGGQESDVATSVAVDANGNVFVAGSFRATLDDGAGHSVTSAGGADGFVMKLDATGTPQWVERFGGDNDDGASTLMIDAYGSIVVGGSFTGTATVGGKTFTAGTDYDGILITLGGDGTISNSRALGASARGAYTGLAPRQGGGFVAVGLARGSLTLAGKDEVTSYTDGFLVSIDGAGVEDWAKLFGTYENDEATGIAIAPNGHLFVSATVGSGALDLGGGPLAYELSDGGLVLELDEVGQHVCSRRLSATSNDEPIGDSATVKLGGAVSGFAIAADKNNATIFGGAFSGTTDLGSGPRASSASVDALVAKFSAWN